MRRRLVAISVSLVALASLVFAGSNGLPSLSSPQPQQRTQSRTSAQEKKKPDYVDMKSDEGWQMEHNGRKIMVVVGNFAAHHNGTVITADSAVRYSERHIECFGNVLINRGSTYIYGDRAEYNGATNEAKVYSKIVKVVDGNATLFTYNFIFNTKSNIGRYSGGGVLVSGENMLESDRGYLYSDSHDIICVERVQMRNNEYELIGDSVVYNTETDYAQFFTRTNIWNKNESGDNKEDDYLYADRGSFDKRQQLYKLTKNGYILTKDQEVLCDSLDYYRDSNYLLLRHNVQIDDITQKMMIFGDWGEYWKEPGNVFVTRNPSLISYDLSQSDSVFMRADSMFVYTRYPIREKVEKARQDSIARAMKAAAVADSLKSVAEKSAPAEKVAKADKVVKNNQPAEDAELSRRQEREAHREAQKAKRESARMREKAEHEMPQQSGTDRAQQPPHAALQQRADAATAADAKAADTTKVVADTTKVATDSTKVVVKSKAELRREMIDSLASDTTKQGMRLRAKLLKEESAEVNRAVKAAVKESLRKRAEERAKVWAEREVLYKRVLGEAMIRDAKRDSIAKLRAKAVKDSLKYVKDSLKRVAKLPQDSLVIDSLKLDSIRLDSLKLDSLKLDSLKLDSLKRDTLKVDSIKIDSIKVDSLKTDTLKVDTLKADTLKADSLKLDSLAKFDTMTVKQVKAYFKSLYDADRAEDERIKQDSLEAKLDRIGLARQAKRTEQYKKWARRDSIYNAKLQERADEQLRRKLARLEKRGIFIEMADSSELRIVDSILRAEFGPLDTVVNHRLDSIIALLFPKLELTPTQIIKADSMNLDSLYREIRAFSRVKMYRSDAQSVCDSLTMTTIDSIIHMYKSPILWNGSSQITSEIMHIKTRNSQLERADFEGSPLTVAEIDTAHYNQVTGKEMASLFRNGEMYRNDVNGNVQTIYYMQEDNSPEITLMAYIEAGDMTSYIKDQQIEAITYRGSPVYTFYPMDKIPETQPKKLPNFTWQINRRPLRDSVFNRTIRPSQRIQKRSLRKPLFPINALLQQRKDDYMRRREWQDRTDTLTYETIEWLESLKTF